ncbi:MAG TPA: ATP-binding cassette domain-containing protein [Polyangia bacterium]
MTPDSPPPALEVVDLSVDYLADAGTVRALEAVSFQIAPGEIFGLCGQSGSGKSTLAAAVPRLLPLPALIRKGRIVVAGRDVTAAAPRELQLIRGRLVGFVPQSGMNALHPQLSVGRQIANVLRAHSQGTQTPQVAELLTTVGLTPEVAQAFAHHLSGGMRQRAALAIALAAEPVLLIMDEALGALDVIVRHQICATLVEMGQRRGFATLFISHDLPLTLGLADRVGILHEGRLVEVGSVAQIRDEPRDAHTRALLAAFAEPRGTRAP